MKLRMLIAALHLVAGLAAVSGASAQYAGAPAPAPEKPADPPADKPADQPADKPAPEYDSISFTLDRSPGIVAANCVPYAKGDVKVVSQGPVEVMDVYLSGLPAKTEFDLFVIQVPNFPFGMSWYQGDMETDEYGNAHGQFIGRFNIETFIIAPGTAPAPQIHYEPTADAKENPATAPVHTFHLGPLVQLSGRCRQSGLPRRDHAVQWRAQCGRSGSEHRELPGSGGPAQPTRLN